MLKPQSGREMHATYAMLNPVERVVFLYRESLRLKVELKAQL
jgi:hypothetical protein